MISIITPTYNSKEYLEETMNSIHNQDKSLFEHIVIDGASNDNTVTIIKQFPVDYTISEPDKGQSDAINKGFRVAQGDIMAWQNADDLYMPDTFETVYNFFAENPDVDIVYGDYNLIDPSGNKISSVKPIEWNEWKFKHWRFVPLQPTVFWRKKVFDVVGELDINLHYTMDLDFFARMLNAGFKFKKINKTLGEFRVHNASKTQNSLNWKDIKIEIKDVLNRNFSYSVLDYIWFEIFYNRARLSTMVRHKLRI